MPSEEAKVLLRHPDYRERALALKLNSITPHDIALAILDPHESVWRAAFKHPDSQHALDVLSSASRDATGLPIHDRHEALLNDPRCTYDHVKNMHRAVSEDAYLPIPIQAHRLMITKERLAKRENEQIRLSHYDDPLESNVKVSQEEPRHPELLKIYNRAVNSFSPIPPEDADLHDVGAASPKVVYHVPTEKGTFKFLVKPYQELDRPHSGWAEGTSQDIYSAAEVPHLHQKSFVASYNNKGSHIPVTVIQMEEAKPIYKMTTKEILDKNPNAREDARKVAVLDFLTGNPDRHNGNLMIRPNGSLMAIDHALSGTYDKRHSNNTKDPFEFDYTPTSKIRNHLSRYTVKAPSLLTATTDSPSNPIGAPDYHKTIKEWWPNVSSDVRRAFDKRLELISNPAIKRHLQRGFEARHQWLDNAAKTDYNNFLEELRKSIEHIPDYDDPNVDPIEKPLAESKQYDTVHKELLNAHPYHLQPQVDTFEKYINHPTQAVKTERGELDGIEQKSLVSHGDKKYLLKAANTKWNPLSGWGELTSQALFHAGGLGDIHQHSHATNLNIKEGDNTRSQPAVVVHFKPGNWEMLGDRTNKTDPINKNKDTLRKAYVMDFLTGNSDRHDENIMFNQKDEPQLIDHGFSFRRDNWPNPKIQAIRDFREDPEAKNISVGKWPFKWDLFRDTNEFARHKLFANNNTYQWWQQHKAPILEAFEKHINMIPDKKERANRRGMFYHRVEAVDQKHPIVFGDNLTKTLGNAQFLHDQHYEWPEQQGYQADTSGVHEKLMQSHPNVVNPGVRHFEITLNSNKANIKPTVEQDELKGLQPKALYESGGKKYLVKPAKESSTALGAWNEATSQAMYHAGSIGHLHGKSHATIAKTGLNRTEPSHATIIHIEPNVMTFNEAYGFKDPEGVTHAPMDIPRARKSFTEPKNKQNLKKIGVMDYLTGNHDRHGHNLLLKPDGSVIGIDAGRSFYNDRKYALGNEMDEELENHKHVGLNLDPTYQNQFFNSWKDHMYDSAATGLGGGPDDETWDWWDKAKEPMLQKFKEHVSMLPDPEVRDRMIESFLVRYNRLNDLRKFQNTPGQNNQKQISSDQDQTDLANPRKV